MDIRKDFKSADPYLHRLLGMAAQFAAWDNNDWPHLKNGEDYRRILAMEFTAKNRWDNLYCDGRSIAGYMRSHLQEFNEFGLFPTLTSYVESFENNWVSSIEDLEEQHREFEEAATSTDTPWAVHRMISLWADQVRLLKATKLTIAALKQTDIYKQEQGDFSMTASKIGINIHTINNSGNMQITSNDHSNNSETQKVFFDLRELISKSEIPSTDKSQLSERLDSFQAVAGKPGAIERYKDFMALAANHATVLAPLLPMLASLI